MARLTSFQPSNSAAACGRPKRTSCALIVKDGWFQHHELVVSTHPVGIIEPSKLAILRLLPLRHTGSNPSIGGSKILRVVQKYESKWVHLPQVSG